MVVWTLPFAKPGVFYIFVNMKLISAPWCCYSFAEFTLHHDLSHKNSWINHYH